MRKVRVEVGILAKAVGEVPVRIQALDGEECGAALYAFVNSIPSAATESNTLESTTLSP